MKMHRRFTHRSSSFVAVVFVAAWIALVAGTGVVASASPLTVWTEVSIDETWQANTHIAPVWLVRFDTAEGQAALAVVWRREASGWFATWRLQLYSEVGLIDPDAAHGPQTVNLWTGSPARGRTYAAALSYDPGTGAYSLRVVDTQGGTLLAARGGEIANTGAALHPAAVSGQAYLHRITRTEPAYVPVAAAWSALAVSASGAVPASVLRPGETLGIRLRTYGSPVPGVFRFSVESDAGRVPVWEIGGAEAADAEVRLPGPVLSPGRLRVVMEYAGRDEVLWSEAAELSYGQVEAALAELAVDDATGAFSGEYVLRSDFDLPAAELRIDAEIAQVAWDETQRTYRELAVERRTALETTVPLAAGENRFRFAGSLPQDGAGLYRLRFVPYIGHPAAVEARTEERFVSLAAAACRLSVMSFNIRVEANDGVNAWPSREPLAVAMLRRYAPDLIGLQEPTSAQLYALDRALTDYGRIVIKPDGAARVHNAIYYNTGRIQLLQWGSFWLSDTPDVAQSATWGNSEARAVIWARFRLTATGQEFLMLNTHFHHVDPTEAIGTRSARLIVERLPALAGGLPVILTGDFNAVPFSSPHAVLTGSGLLQDAWLAAARRTGPGNTYHGYGAASGGRIDWILVSPDISVSDIEHVAVREGDVFPSDHYPVYATLCLPLP